MKGGKTLPGFEIVERFRETKQSGVFRQSARLSYHGEQVVAQWDNEKEPLMMVKKAGWTIRDEGTGAVFHFATLDQLNFLVSRLVIERKVTGA